MKRLLALALLSCGFAAAQEAVYVAHYQASSTTNVLTLQQTSTPTKTATLFGDGLGVAVYCSEACTVTFEHSGTAATSTALAITPNSPGLGASAINAFRSSNVGSGTIGPSYQVAAGETKPFAYRATLPQSANANITIRVTSATTSRITATWREY
jgi:hypothetical protein